MTFRAQTTVISRSTLRRVYDRYHHWRTLIFREKDRIRNGRARTSGGGEDLLNSHYNLHGLRAELKRIIRSMLDREFAVSYSSRSVYDRTPELVRIRPRDGHLFVQGRLEREDARKYYRRQRVKKIFSRISKRMSNKDFRRTYGVKWAPLPPRLPRMAGSVRTRTEYEGEEEGSGYVTPLSVFGGRNLRRRLDSRVATPMGGPPGPFRAGWRLSDGTWEDETGPNGEILDREPEEEISGVMGDDPMSGPLVGRGAYCY